MLHSQKNKTLKRTTTKNPKQQQQQNQTKVLVAEREWVSGSQRLGAWEACDYLGTTRRSFCIWIVMAAQIYMC